MRKLFAAVAAVALAGCEGGSAPAADDDAETGDGSAREGEMVVRADGNGAFVDTGAGEIRVDRNGVDVDLEGRDFEATIKTGEDPSISVTTNRR